MFLRVPSEHLGGVHIGRDRVGEKQHVIVMLELALELGHVDGHVQTDPRTRREEEVCDVDLLIERLVRHGLAELVGELELGDGVHICRVELRCVDPSRRERSVFINRQCLDLAPEASDFGGSSPRRLLLLSLATEHRAHHKNAQCPDLFTL